MTIDRGPAISGEFSVATASLIGVGLVVCACTLCWMSVEWEQLQDRASNAESQLVTVQDELADHRRRADELRDIEVVLREEMTELSRLIELQRGEARGLGVSREQIAGAFDGCEFVQQDEPEHYAVERSSGSIHLRGPADNLTRIGFVGSLHGAHRKAATDMLATLLSAAMPQWDQTQRNAWMVKVESVDEAVSVYKDVGNARLTWHRTSRDGDRIDTLSIESP